MPRALVAIDLPLPEDWTAQLRYACISVAGLAHRALTATRSVCADSPLVRVRQAAEIAGLREELALVREELRIKDTRMALIPAPKRPRYPPTERIAILKLRAARNWSSSKAARVFLLSPPTIATWTSRATDRGDSSLLRLPQPVNQFPDFVVLIVHQLRATCPVFGKLRIAQVLARAGLQISASSVKRMLDRPPPASTSSAGPSEAAAGQPPTNSGGAKKGRTVTALRPHHVWHIDLTAVPTACGFWIPWLPFVLAQRWPFGAWVGLVEDHFSRAVVARAIFKHAPSGSEVCALLSKAVRSAKMRPKHIVSDQGTQFRDEYRAWCKRHKVQPRFGAVGQHGSIAIIERFIRTLKEEGLRRLLVPLWVPDLEREIDLFLVWYHEHRPHQSLGGATPQEILRGLRKPKPPKRRRKRGGRKRRRPLKLVVTHVQGRRHRPSSSSNEPPERHLPRGDLHDHRRH